MYKGPLQFALKISSCAYRTQCLPSKAPPAYQSPRASANNTRRLEKDRILTLYAHFFQDLVYILITVFSTSCSS